MSETAPPTAPTVSPQPPQAEGRPALQTRMLDAEARPAEIVKAVWTSAQLGGFTEHEARTVKHYAEPRSLHLFCGLSPVGDVRVDLNPTSKATTKADILGFLADAESASFRTVIADPPYNGKYQAEYAVAGKDFGGNEQNLGRLLKEMFRVCAPGGLLIFKHWFDPAWAGAQLLHEVVTKYGGHRRITLLTVYRKSEWGNGHVPREA